jgi:plasmid stabilization system protein ParE
VTEYKDYELHPEAYGDIDEIRGYIAADNPDAADRIVIGVFNAIERLVAFPHQGHRRTDLTNRPLLYTLPRLPDSLCA